EFASEHEGALVYGCWLFSHTNPSAAANGSRGCGGCCGAFAATAPIDTSCSVVGSAQQYQGSLRNGTAAAECIVGNTGGSIPAARWAASQIRANAAERPCLLRSASAAIDCTVSLSVSSRGSSLLQG